jgi:hypothetical protein
MALDAHQPAFAGFFPVGVGSTLRPRMFEAGVSRLGEFDLVTLRRFRSVAFQVGPQGVNGGSCPLDLDVIDVGAVPEVQHSFDRVRVPENSFV